MSKDMVAYLSEKVADRVETRQMAGETQYQHVSNEFGLSEGIRPLAEVVTSIKEKMSSIHNRKRMILEELIYLLQYWDEYTQLDEMVGYQGENGLYRFLSEKVEQNMSTSYADCRIARMLMTYRAAHLLKLDNRINSLKRIAYLSDRRNPERAESERSELLEQLPRLTNAEISQRIDEFNRNKGPVKNVSRNAHRPWHISSSPKRGKIAIKEAAPETVRQLERLLKALTEDTLDEMLGVLQKREKGDQSPLFV
jgi:hypothetical protein